MGVIRLKRKYAIRIAPVVILFMSLSFCAQETPLATIPFAPVNFQIDLNGLDHHLKSHLSYKIFTEQDRRSEADSFGFSGVFIVAGATSSTTFFAYDLCCPHEKKREIRVVPREDGKAECEVCGTLFVTIYGLGTAEEEPAIEPLQRYRVIPIRPGVYRIVN